MMQTMEMEHYVIENQKYNGGFEVLLGTAENLDKNDFMDSAYFVDVKRFPHKGAKDDGQEEGGSRSSRKGKRKALSSRDRDSGEEDIVILLDDKGEERGESPTSE